jgi:hypothetical protein
MATKYTAWCPDYGQQEDDGKTMAVRAYEGPRDMANRWAEWHDVTGAEYDIAGKNKTVRVLVRDLDTNEVTHWNVTGEAVPHYTALSIEMPAYPDVMRETP